MFTNDFDSVAEGLGYRNSSKSLNRMSLKQIESVKKVMVNCPNFMKPLLFQFDEKKLAALFDAHGLGGQEVPAQQFWRTIQSSNITLGHIDPSEKAELLHSLSNSPSMQTLNLPLFLSLYRYWCNNVSTVSNARTSNGCWKEGIRSALELNLQDCSTLLGLIIEEILSCRQDQILTIDMLRAKLITGGKYVDENQLHNISDVFQKYGLLCKDDGVINTRTIHDIFGPSDEKLNVLLQPSDAIMFRLRASYEALKYELLKQVKCKNANGDTISEDEFTSAIKICGLILSRTDAHMLWRHIVSLGADSSVATAASNQYTITTADLHHALFQPAAAEAAEPYSSFSAKHMQQQDSHPRRLRKPIIGAGAGLVSPMKSVFKDAGYEKATTVATASSTAGHRNVEHDGKSESEQPMTIKVASVASPLSNLQSRVMRRLVALPHEQLTAFFEYLQRNCTYSSSEQAQVITRSVMTEALALQGIHISRTEAEQLWATLQNIRHMDNATGFRRKVASNYLTIEGFMSALGLLDKLKLFSAPAHTPIPSKLQCRVDEKSRSLADYLPLPPSQDTCSEENKEMTLTLSGELTVANGVPAVVATSSSVNIDAVHPPAAIRKATALLSDSSGEPPQPHTCVQVTPLLPPPPPSSSPFENDNSSRRLRKASPVKTTSGRPNNGAYSMASILSMQPLNVGGDDLMHMRDDEYAAAMGKGRRTYSIRPSTAALPGAMIMSHPDNPDYFDDQSSAAHRMDSINQQHDDSILREGLTRKLQANSSVRGEKFRLLALAPVLRMRLRRESEVGRGVTQWDAKPDECSLSDLIRVLEAVNVNLTREEATFIAKECSGNSSSNRDHTGAGAATATAAGTAVIGSGKLEGRRDDKSTTPAAYGTEVGIKLSAAILYLSDLL